jgi:hypothetical protein
MIRLLSNNNLIVAGFLMKFLRIRGSSKRVRADGSLFKEASFIEKNRKYGAQISEQIISVKKSILVTGAHDSGKTRFIKRLYDNERAIYGAKILMPALWLGSLRPLSSWTDMAELSIWFEGGCKTNPKKLLWSSLKAYEKAERLAEYVAQTKAVVFVDDAHKLSGRKLQIARECVMAAHIYVMSASDEQRIPPNLRGLVLKRDPQVFRLSTDTSYDMTTPLMYLAMLFFVSIGFWEASAVLGGLKYLASGSRATRDK